MPPVVDLIPNNPLNSLTFFWLDIHVFNPQLKTKTELLRFPSNLAESPGKQLRRMIPPETNTHNNDSLSSIIAYYILL